MFSYTHKSTQLFRLLQCFAFPHYSHDTSTKVVFDSNKVSNSPKFCGRKTERPQTPLYVPGLELLLGLNFKIITIGYALAITPSSADIRSSNGAG